MHILVNRFHSTPETTFSNVYIDDKWSCCGLEDEYREQKVAGETRIPRGTYPVHLRLAETPLTLKYRNQFDWFDFHLHIQNVPNFTDIYIHVGNRDKHTDGCLLLGQGVNPVKGRLYESIQAYKAFYEKVYDAAKNKRLTIELVDSDIAKPLRVMDLQPKPKPEPKQAPSRTNRPRYGSFLR